PRMPFFFETITARGPNSPVGSAEVRLFRTCFTSTSSASPAVAAASDSSSAASAPRYFRRRAAIDGPGRVAGAGASDAAGGGGFTPSTSGMASSMISLGVFLLVATAHLLPGDGVFYHAPAGVTTAGRQSPPQAQAGVLPQQLGLHR